MTTREYKILGAASARSTIDEFTVWALSCHSLRDHLTATTRTKLPFPMRAPMAASHSLFPRVVKERGAITDLIQPVK